MAVLALALVCAACAKPPEGPPATPDMVKGAPARLLPMPPGTPATSRAAQLAGTGHTEEEWALTGRARRYAPAGPWARDGRWALNAITAPEPYRTRLLVRRPADPRRFNGVVVVEWLNTTLGFELDGGWVLTREELVREGYAWVGVSAEPDSAKGLQALQAARYEAQHIASKALAYDVFTQAGEAVRTHGSQMLGSDKPLTLLAMGYSQSAVFLTTYLNAFQPLSRTYQGFLLHGSAPAAGPVLDGDSGHLLPRIRPDLGTPVMQVQTEMEVSVSWSLSHTADTDHVRYWEVAGAAHLDHRMQDEAMVVGPSSFRDQAPSCLKPSNTLPTEVVDHAALHALRRWVSEGVAPPTVPRLQRSWLGFVQSDTDGNALGGFRLPDLDQPLAQYGMYSNVPTASLSVASIYLCVAGGSTNPWDAAQRSTRHGDASRWLAAYRAQADALRDAGLMRPADHAATLARARAQRWPEALR